MREVLVLSLPLVISTMSWTLMHFIDRIFLLSYSTESVAAALPSGNLSFAVICLPLGITSYVNTFVSQYHGAGRPEKIGVSVWQGVGIGLLTLPFVLATIPLAPWFFSACDHPVNVARQEAIFYQVNCWGDAAIIISASLSSFFTGRGRVRTVMIVDSLAALTNMVLDYAWIFGHWGFPESGIAGAAWATVVALWLKTFLYLILFLRPRYRERYGTASGCRFDPEIAWRLLRYGLPSGMQLLLEVAGYAVFLLFIGKLGEMDMAATSLAFNVNNLAFMPVLGLGLATSTLVGHRMGEERPDLAARVTRSAFVIGAGYMLLISAFYVLTPDLILKAHWSIVEQHDFHQLRDLTVVLLRFVAAYCLFDAMNVIFSAAIKGAGDTRFVMITTTITSAIPVLLTWLGLYHFGLGIYWAWIVMTGWVTVLGFIYMARFMQGKWRSMRVIEDPLIGDSQGTAAAVVHAGEALSH
ncbi:MAG TPA: MATE family efflux transporter [Pirellulales bacterium]|nr:MATE family efflux transporter [Pirellulales bacterium]